MDIRVLRYFAATVQAGSISKASAALYITQPTLSRQFKELEDELGQQLFIRGSRSITLTPAGELFYQRALSILDLVNKTKAEFDARDQELSGTVSIVAGESPSMSTLADILTAFHKDYPNVRINMHTGDESQVRYMLKSGLADFGLIIYSTGKGFSEFDYLMLPNADRWGVMVRDDSPLAGKEQLTAKDVYSVPLICPEQIYRNDELKSFLNGPVSSLNIAATYRMTYNGYLMARAGFADLLGLEGIVRLAPEDHLRFVPLKPEIKAHLAVVWQKQQNHGKAAARFLTYLQQRTQA